MVLFQLYDTQKRCIFQHLNVNFYVFFTFKKIYIMHVWEKRIIYCHVQLYTDAFLRRKAAEKWVYKVAL